MTPPRTLEFLDATHVRVRGRTLLYFAGCNYLGLSFHRGVRQALATAAASGPLQAGASRATTGEQPAYRRLEKQLASFFRVPEAVGVATGYLAPIAACQSLRTHLTHVLLDDRAHACVVDGARLTGVPVRTFAHGRLDELAARLKRLPRGSRPLIACDGTCGTRGGATPVDAYLAVLPTDGWLLVDDAHGAGTVGPGGRGLCAHLQIRDPRVIQTISLAKAFGVGGGAILGAADVIAAVRRQASGWIGSTAPLLPAVAAVTAALRVLIDEPERIQRLQAHARQLHQQLPKRPEIVSDPRTPVVGVFPTSEDQTRALHRALQRAGICPPFIHYLPGPAPGFFRFAVLADHTAADVQRLATVLAQAKW